VSHKNTKAHTRLLISD